MSDTENILPLPAADGPDPALALLLERVKRQIRQTVEARRPAGTNSGPQKPDPAQVRAANARLSLDLAHQALDLARQAADPSEARPAAARSGGLRGLFARVLGKVILKLIWFVAERQWSFNRATLAALAEAARLNAQLASRVASLEAALRDAHRAPAA